MAFAVYTVRTDVAQAVVNECAGSPDSSICYEDTISGLYPDHSVDEVFEIVRLVRSLDTSYQFCHVLAHKLGERVVAEDPDRWLEAMSLNPSDGMCSNGFIHGVIGGRFRAEVLDDATLARYVPDFRRACEPREDWQATGLDRAICYHGMGHLYVFITDADISKALGLCEQTAPLDVRRVCAEGVFMQIYQPLEPDDFELLKRLPYVPERETYRAFCGAFSEGRAEYLGACQREAWPLYRAEILDGSGAESFCDGQPNMQEEMNCYVTVSTIIGRMSLGSPETAAAACRRLPNVQQSICFESVARAVLEEDKNAAAESVALCLSAGGQAGIACLDRLMQTQHFIFGDNVRQQKQFCAVMPESVRSRCALR